MARRGRTFRGSRRRMAVGGRYHSDRSAANSSSNSCPPGTHMMPDGTCMNDNDPSMNGGGYRRGGRTRSARTRRMEHGGSHCGPGMMYQNGGCVSYQDGGRVQINNSNEDRLRRKR